MKRTFDTDSCSPYKRIEVTSTSGTKLRADVHLNCATFPRHTHDYFEIEIVAEGEGIHILNGKSYELKRGSFYLVTPTDYHEFFVEKGKEMTIWNVSFDENFLDARMRYEVASNTFLPAVLAEEELAYVKTLFELLCREYKRTEEACTVSLLDCLLCLLRRTSREQNANNLLKDSADVERALAYLQEHFLDGPDLKTAASSVGFHPAYFSTLFKRALGIGYTEYLNHLRIAYAKSLLARGASVSEACFGCGFASLSNFQHTFKKFVLMTPSEYKREHRAATLSP